MKGLLTVIGSGPGDPNLIVPAAKREIKKAEVIAGYPKYLKLLGTLIDGKKTITTGMRKETERVEEALKTAAEGNRVCLVSSGDAGIYGMAGLALEMLYDKKLEDVVEVKVMPGITAASSCASLLGAPLMHDFCVISLSNLLTKTELIELRLKLAAEGDFVTVLYNPKSSRRVELIETARKTFLNHRSPNTPVGIVNDAYRDSCTVDITTLEKLCDDYENINMSSTVIIGNSSTKHIGGHMITPRGYQLGIN
ncbi:MAG TPA: precorrin-3B C(17)-methyltransferase [Spirochaeta sp.]|nr:precorrin-3B C(17)-methyltransferase [Spirochaeta sp.]